MSNSACEVGTNSAKSIVVDAVDGGILSAPVKHYARWAQGRGCVAGKSPFRQHPLGSPARRGTSIRQRLAGANAAYSMLGLGLVRSALDLVRSALDPERLELQAASFR